MLKSVLQGMSRSSPTACHCMPHKQTHQTASTALRSAAPASDGSHPGRYGRLPSVAIAASSSSTASTKTSTSVKASHEPGDVPAGRTAVPIVRGLGAVDDDRAAACRSFQPYRQSNQRLHSRLQRPARPCCEQTLISLRCPTKCNAAHHLAHAHHRVTKRPAYGAGL
jgi:hypothetical protein